MLVEFSAGVLGSAESICVSAHLHFCSKCRETLLQLDQLGSKLMAEADVGERTSRSFEEVMKKIEFIDESSAEQTSTEIESEVHFAPVVDQLMKRNSESLKWKKLSSSVDMARLDTGQDKFEVSLHKICIFCRAKRTLDFTVPKGTPSSWEVSECDLPSIYTFLRISFCSTGRRSIAA